MEDLLLSACKRLHFSSNLVAEAKKIKADNHLDFLLTLFNAELDQRDRKRRNAYQKAAKFDLIKTFEDYTFEDIKFPTALSQTTCLQRLLFHAERISSSTAMSAPERPIWPLLWASPPVTLVFAHASGAPPPWSTLSPRRKGRARSLAL